MRLKGKSVVITGASSGIGRAITERFVNEGAKVIAVARRAERLEELAGTLKSAPGKIIAFAGDISLKETNEAMIEAALREFGRLDVLVNNAGIMDDMGPVGDLYDEKFEQIMKVNLYGPMTAMRKAVNVFIEQGEGGSIINVASIGARKTVAGAAYSASKAALAALSRNTAFMYIPQKIRSNVIAPGGIETEISGSMGIPNEYGFSRAKLVMAANPGIGKGEDIANAALFLASDESTFVNGDVLTVDGGWCAG